MNAYASSIRRPRETAGSNVRPPSAEERLATIRELFARVQQDARGAESREELTDLHRQAGYFVRLARAVSTGLDAGPRGRVLATLAEEEFARTVDVLNGRGRELGLAMDLPAGPDA